MWDPVASTLNNIGGIGGGIGILVTVAGFAATYGLPFVLPLPLRALRGKWWSYSYYHTRDPAEGDRSPFYREQIVVHHRKIFPWMLWLEAVPLTRSDEAERIGRPTRYSGAIWYRSARVFIRAREPIYDDECFVILNRVMDNRHTDDKLVGIALGNSYDGAVSEATAIVMSRRPLVPASPELSDDMTSDAARAEFDRIVNLYIRLKPNTPEMLLI